MKSKMNKKGFSILELIIVIALLSVIFLVFIMNFRNTGDDLTDTEMTVTAQAFNAFYQTGRDNQTILWFREEGSQNQISCVRLSSLIEQGFMEEEVIGQNGWTAATIFRIVVNPAGQLTYTVIAEAQVPTVCGFEEIAVSDAHQPTNTVTDTRPQGHHFTIDNQVRLHDFNVFRTDVNFTYHEIGPITSTLGVADIINMGQPFNLHTGALNIAAFHTFFITLTVTPIQGTGTSIITMPNAPGDSLVVYTDRVGPTHRGGTIRTASGTLIPLNAPGQTTVQNSDIIGSTFIACLWCNFGPHNTGGCAQVHTDSMTIETTFQAEYTHATVQFFVNEPFFRIVAPNGQELTNITQPANLTNMVGPSISQLFNFNLRYLEENDPFSSCPPANLSPDGNHCTVPIFSNIRVTLTSTQGLAPIVRDIGSNATVVISRGQGIAIN